MSSEENPRMILQLPPPLGAGNILSGGRSRTQSRRAEPGAPFKYGRELLMPSRTSEQLIPFMPYVLLRRKPLPPTQPRVPGNLVW